MSGQTPGVWVLSPMRCCSATGPSMMQAPTEYRKWCRIGSDIFAFRQILQKMHRVFFMQVPRAGRPQNGKKRKMHKQGSDRSSRAVTWSYKLVLTLFWTLFLEILQKTYEINIKYIRYIQNGCLKEAQTIQRTLWGRRSRPPKGMLLSLASFRQPFCMYCIYFVYISYIFCYILVYLLYSNPPRANPNFRGFRHMANQSGYPG